MDNILLSCRERPCPLELSNLTPQQFTETATHMGVFFIISCKHFQTRKAQSHLQNPSQIFMNSSRPMEFTCLINSLPLLTQLSSSKVHLQTRLMYLQNIHKVKKCNLICDCINQSRKPPKKPEFSFLS